MDTKTRLASAATVLTLVLGGCGTEDIDPGAVTDVEEAGEQARAQAEEALTDLEAEAQEMVDQVQTEEAPEAKEELLDRCREAVESLRDADMESSGDVEDICERIEGTDVTNMDLWNEIRQQIDDLQVN